MNAIHSSVEPSEMVGRTHFQHWHLQITPCILLNDFGGIVASKLGTRLSVRYGLRYSMFANAGPATVHEYDDDFQALNGSTLLDLGIIGW